MAKERDESWRHHDTPWARLKWARQQKFRSGEDGAVAVGMAGHTYRAYERPDTSSKHTEMTYDNAFHFARVFGVRWEWLMEGRGVPWPEPGPLERLAQEFAQVSPEKQKAVADAVRALLRTGTDG